MCTNILVFMQVVGIPDASWDAGITDSDFSHDAGSGSPTVDPCPSPTWTPRLGPASGNPKTWTKFGIYKYILLCTQLYYFWGTCTTRMLWPGYFSPLPTFDIEGRTFDIVILRYRRCNIQYRRSQNDLRDRVRYDNSISNVLTFDIECLKSDKRRY